MKKTQPSSSASAVDPSDLRRRAEARLKESGKENSRPPSEPDLLRLVHELQVHQVELEMQNEELRVARAEAEASLAQYTDLYDFAPVGYVTLDEQGLILKANLTTGKLLGVERSRLLKQPLNRFIAPEDQDAYHRHRQRLLDIRAPQECELRILRADDSALWVQMSTSVERDPSTGSGPGAGGTPVCRVALSDITDRKQAEEGLRTANEELRDFNQAMVGRELRMIELKREINESCAKAGLPTRYDVEEEEKGAP